MAEREEPPRRDSEGRETRESGSQRWLGCPQVLTPEAKRQTLHVTQAGGLLLSLCSHCGGDGVGRVS